MGFKTVTHNGDGSVTITDTRTLAEAKAERRNYTVDWMQNHVFAGGHLSNSGFIIPTDQQSMTWLLCLYQLASAGIGNAFPVQDGAGGWHLLTAAQLVNVAKDAMQFFVAALANGKAIFDAIGNCMTPDDVDAVDYQSGWPT